MFSASHSLRRTISCRTLAVALLVAAVSASTGCGQKLPEGMPDLHPVTITLTQDGKPLDGALVNLYPESPENSQWACGGTSDAQGKVVVTTNGQFNGAPAGKYAASVSKTLAENLPQSADDPPADIYALVETRFNDPTTSELTLEVVAGKNNVEFQVGSAVKIQQ